MKKRIAALLAALSLLSAVLTGCGGGSNGNGGQTDNNGATDAVTARAAAGELNVGIAQDLDSSLDPHKTVKAGTREVMFNVFEGLLKPDSTGDLKPALAESYTVSDDHLLYTVRLRSGVKFHNGQDVTPEDVIWSYQRCGNPDSADIIQVAAFADAEIYQEGENTVCFRLSEPSNEFISYLTTAVLPKDYTEQDTAPVGTGRSSLCPGPRRTLWCWSALTITGAKSQFEQGDLQNYRECGQRGDEPPERRGGPVRPPDRHTGGAAWRGLPCGGGHHESGAGAVSQQRRGAL